MGPADRDMDRSNTTECLHQTEVGSGESSTQKYQELQPPGVSLLAEEGPGPGEELSAENR